MGKLNSQACNYAPLERMKTASRFANPSCFDIMWRPQLTLETFGAMSDTEVSRAFEVDIGEWYVPVNIVTEEVDYANVTVQVRETEPRTQKRGGKGEREREEENRIGKERKDDSRARVLPCRVLLSAWRFS